MQRNQSCCQKSYVKRHWSDNSEWEVNRKRCAGSAISHHSKWLRHAVRYQTTVVHLLHCIHNDHQQDTRPIALSVRIKSSIHALHKVNYMSCAHEWDSQKCICLCKRQKNKKYRLSKSTWIQFFKFKLMHKRIIVLHLFCVNMK